MMDPNVNTPRFQEMRFRIREAVQMVSLRAEMIELARNEIVMALAKENATHADYVNLLGLLRHAKIESAKLDKCAHELEDSLKSIIEYLETNETK